MSSAIAPAVFGEAPVEAGHEDRAFGGPVGVEGDERVELGLGRARAASRRARVCLPRGLAVRAPPWRLCRVAMMTRSTSGSASTRSNSVVAYAAPYCVAAAVALWPGPADDRLQAQVVAHAPGCSAGASPRAKTRRRRRRRRSRRSCRGRWVGFGTTRSADRAIHRRDTTAGR